MFVERITNEISSGHLDIKKHMGKGEHMEWVMDMTPGPRLRAK